MISTEEVQHIAKLARLELSEAEIKKMQKDLSAILDYFNLLKKCPSPKAIKAVKGDLKAARKDELQKRDAAVVEKLIANAPDKKDDYIKVKNVF